MEDIFRENNNDNAQNNLPCESYNNVNHGNNQNGALEIYDEDDMIPYSNQGTSREEEFEQLLYMRKNLSIYMGLKERFKKKREEHVAKVIDLNNEKASLTSAKRWGIEKSAYDDYDYGSRLKWVSCIIGVAIFIVIYCLYDTISDMFKIRDFGFFLLNLIISLIVPVTAFVTVSVYKKRYCFDARLKRKLEETKDYRKREEHRINNQISINENNIKYLENEIDSLTKQFYSMSFIIHPQDYEYVDYLIFLYNSGRALDLRDSLLQLDQQVRANQIVSAIDNMQHEISAQIQNLCGTISHKLNKLSATIDKNNFLLDDVNKNLSGLQASNAYTQSLLREGNAISSSNLRMVETFSEHQYGIRSFR